ncbi:hypothetical protein [Vibrio mediterranei]|uniref:hypothetical protein n=1 Tax=Vibrio mediterranei TaxID=689 RepID=UPI0011804BB9|nr:hypothetical protein [Vibrio mediterranei]
MAYLIHIETLSMLSELLSQPRIQQQHLYCHFQKGQLTHHHLMKLQERKIKSVSFEDAHTIYPYHPFTQLHDATR